MTDTQFADAIQRTLKRIETSDRFSLPLKAMGFIAISYLLQECGYKGPAEGMAAALKRLRQTRHETN